jgi:peptidoglycan/xylan/chitin deacetylase (PgdA/CDA1 family)
VTLVPVLMYHAVGRPIDDRFRRWVVSPSLLAEHLSSINDAGYKMIGLSQWAAQADAQKCVVLTFDDGYVDFMDSALPILLANGATATVYVVTGYVGDRARWLPFEGERHRPIMGWGDLARIHESGIEIGSHGHRHIELDSRSAAAAERDVRQSREALLQHGFTPTSFCYPFGYANHTVRDIVARAGFTTACIVGRGLADSDQDLMRIRRIEVDHQTTSQALLHRFHGPAVSASARIRAAAQPTWRQTRRLRAAARGLKAEAYQ